MEELARHCMEDLDPEFTRKVKKGDLIFADENFGCGSSREHAPLVLKEIGISCIVAKSFARIFYRNAINVGLPILSCIDAADRANEGETAIIDVIKGSIRIGDQKFTAAPFPPFVLEIVQLGGLMPYVRKAIDASLIEREKRE